MIALTDLAREAEGGLTTLSGISERQEISLASDLDRFSEMGAWEPNSYCPEISRLRSRMIPKIRLLGPHAPAT